MRTSTWSRVPAENHCQSVIKGAVFGFYVHRYIFYRRAFAYFRVLFTDYLSIRILANWKRLVAIRLIIPEVVTKILRCWCTVQKFILLILLEEIKKEYRGKSKIGERVKGGFQVPAQKKEDIVEEDRFIEGVESAADVGLTDWTSWDNGLFVWATSRRRGIRRMIRRGILEELGRTGVKICRTHTFNLNQDEHLRVLNTTTAWNLSTLTCESNLFMALIIRFNLIYGILNRIVLTTELRKILRMHEGSQQNTLCEYFAHECVRRKVHSSHFLFLFTL